MDACEVDECGGGEDRVASTRCDGHARENNEGGGAGGSDGHGNEEAAMAPVEAVAQAKSMMVHCAQSGAGVEEAVADVNGPGGEGQQGWDPDRERDASIPGEGKGPDYGDRWGVEAR